MTTGRTRFASARRIGGGLFAAAMVITACSSELPTSAEVQKMDVAAAEKQATRLAFVDTVDTRYILDDKVVTKEFIRGLKADEIGSVAVTKRDGKAMDEVRVTSLKRDLYKTELDGRSQPMTGDSVIIRDGVPLQGVRVRVRDSSKVAEVRVKDAEMKRTFDGLLLIDEKITNPDALNRLDPAMIDKVEVIKGVAATQQFTDPRAANGVIKVTLKKR